MNAYWSRKAVTGVAAATALLMIAACGDGGSEAADSEQDTLGLIDESTISVGYMNGLIPYVFEENGELTGVDGDLFLRAAEGLNREIDAQGLEFAAMIAGVQSGRYDIGIGGIAWGAERQEEGIFTDPVYYSPTMLLAKPGLNLVTIEDLEGLTLGAVAGSRNDDATRATPGVEAVTYPAWAQAVDDLGTGRLDAINIDPLTAVHLSETRPDLDQYEVHVIESPTDEQVEANPGLLGYNPYQVAWYCSKQAEALCAALTDELHEMYQNGASAEILTNWGVDPVDFLTSTPDVAEQRIGVDRDEDWTPPTIAE